MTLVQYRSRLALIETAIDNCYKTGQTFAVTGSFSGTNWPLERLQKERDNIRRIILRLSGYGATRTLPDFY